MRVEAVVERLWPGRAVRLEVLGGGITNHNVKLCFDDGETYVLRVAGERTELLGIDRAAEHEASIQAAAVGVGPEVVAFVEPEGWLVTRFIDGRILPPEQVREPDCRGASRSRSARCTPARRSPGASTPSVWSRPTARPPRRTAREFPTASAARSSSRGASRPSRPRARAALPQRPLERELHRRRRACADRRLGVRRHGRRLLRPRQPRRQPRARRRGLPRAAAGVLGRGRSGRPAGPHTDAFHVRLPRGDVGSCPGCVSELDFDFVAYAAEHFDRLERTAAERAFRRALG